MLKVFDSEKKILKPWYFKFYCGGIFNLSVKYLIFLNKRWNIPSIKCRHKEQWKEWGEVIFITNSKTILNIRKKQNPIQT